MAERQMVIYLIEDDQDDMKKMKDCLNDYAQNSYSNDKYTFEVKVFEGTVEQKYYGRDMKFYEMDDIIRRIEEAQSVEEQRNHKMGILLDVLLTEEENESGRGNYYPVSQIARKIYSKFHKQMPICIVTSLPFFATQSDIIIGAELRENYILKQDLHKKADKDVKLLFDYYADWTGAGND